MKKAVLVLEDGSHYTGKLFGKDGESFGQLVFNTSMTGYQEILTDPCYRGKIVVFTYPVIGNYGFSLEDNESPMVQANGVIFKELFDESGNWRSQGSLDIFLKNNGVTGIWDIDTRHLAHRIRDKGSMWGIISSINDNVDALLDKVNLLSGLHTDLVSEITVNSVFSLEGSGPRIVVMDLGVKYSLINILAGLDCHITLVPAYTGEKEILSFRPDGIILSGGPGDPSMLPYAVETVKSLIGQKPMLGIGLGCQVTGMAAGMEIGRLKSGHYGNTQPVKDLSSGRIYMTSQHHSFALKNNDEKDFVTTHINMNDNTVEGFASTRYQMAGIQFHPVYGSTADESSCVLTEFIAGLNPANHRKGVGICQSDRI